MKISTTALFGGALLAAGMCVPANAQTFTFQDDGVVGGNTFPSFATAFANTNYGVGQDIVAYAPDDLNISVSAYGTTASVHRDSNRLRVNAFWDGTASELGALGYGGSRIQQFFTVTSDGFINLSWDLSNTDFFGSASLVLQDGGTIISLNSAFFQANPTGNQLFAVSAGSTYAAILNMGQPFFFEENRDYFIQARLVPAPGMIGLAGFAGLAAMRRRR